MDEQACDDRLLELPHPDGLSCPRCGGTEAFVHRHLRAPVLDDRCKGCGAVYSTFTGTDWQGTHFLPGQIVLILRGFAWGRSTAGLARVMGCSTGHLMERRHATQARARAEAAAPLPDIARRPTRPTRIRGIKGTPHVDPAGPPRRRANMRSGHGT